MKGVIQIRAVIQQLEVTGMSSPSMADPLLNLLREIFPSACYRADRQRYEIGGSILLTPSEAALILDGSPTAGRKSSPSGGEIRGESEQP